MEIEGDLTKARKMLLEDYLDENRTFLEDVTRTEINLPPIHVKYVKEQVFEGIWKIGRCDHFYEDFLGNLRQSQNETNNPKNDRDIYFKALMQVMNSILAREIRYCEPIVAFVSDLNFKELKNKYSDIIEFPGIYVKNKENDDTNLDFGILYSLIKAQIYYSMSRTNILRPYEGINSVLYSAMALKVMKDSEFATLIQHQKDTRSYGGMSNGLAGSWAIPLDLLILSSIDSALDAILDDDLIRKVFFGEDIDEKEWLRAIGEKLKKKR